MPTRPVNLHPTVADILLRVSTTGQAESDRFSLPTQETACRAMAVAKGWTVHAVQQDAITGETIYRPGFQAVLDDLAQGRIGRVIVYDVDRAGRGTYVGATLLHACKEAGATLHIQQMPDLELGGDSQTAYMAETMFFMRLTQAAQHLRSIRENTQRGRAARLAAGKPLVSTPLFGYVVVHDGRGVPIGFREHPAYGDIVRRIFREVAAGVTLGEVCRGLERDGIPTKSQVEQEQRADAGLAPSRRPVATHWYRSAVADIIRHPAYAGQPAANRNPRSRTYGMDPETGQPRMRTRREHPRAEDVVPLSLEVWPPLVDAALAEQARTRLRANQEESVRRLDSHERETMLLRGGYVYCFQCGKPLSAKRLARDAAPGERAEREYCCDPHNNAPGRAFTDHCRQRIPAAALDAEVWEHVLRLADADEDIIETAMASWHARVSTRKGREQAELHRAAHLVELATRDEANKRRTLHSESDERYAAQLRVDWKAAVDAMEQAQARLATLQERFAHDPATAAYDAVTAWARDWRHRLSPDTPYAERRQALHVLGLRVFVWPPEGRMAGRSNGVRQRHAAAKALRRFVVVLGWPAGVRQAIPWTVTPLGASGLDSAYMAEYFPGLKVLEEEAANGQHHGLASELARLVPADVPAQELLLLAEDVGATGAATEPG